MSTRVSVPWMYLHTYFNRHTHTYPWAMHTHVHTYMHRHTVPMDIHVHVDVHTCASGGNYPSTFADLEKLVWPVVT